MTFSEYVVHYIMAFPRSGDWIGLSARNRARDLKHKYGVSIGFVNALYESQHRGCAVCGHPVKVYGRNQNLDKAQVDHDHVTGKVRGLLCRQCNLLLGNARDSCEVLEKAIAYLKFHK